MDNGKIEQLQSKLNKLRLLGINLEVAVENDDIILVKVELDSSIGSLVVPEGITVAGYKGFKGCKAIKEIKLSSTVRVISPFCFMGYKSLEKVELNEGLETIEMDGFRRCFHLKEISIPDSVTKIGRRAFDFCEELRKVKLSNSLQIIERYTFLGCRKLRDILFPDKLDCIDSGAFEGCTGLRILNLKGCTKIAESAFTNCKGLEEISVDRNRDEVTINEPRLKENGFIRVKFKDGEGKWENGCTGKIRRKDK